jgi:8-oxo-dGTP pyrophosphatase MutT (NUDIX family)
VLLFYFVFDEGALAGQRFWATPGGALGPRESYEAAARRELLEETGIVADVGEEVAQRDVVFVMPDGTEVFADERYFAVRVESQAVDRRGHSALEARVMKAHRWWSPDELRDTGETVFPEYLAEMIERLVGHG